MMKKMIFLFNPRSGKEAIKNQLSDILGIFCRAGYLPSVYVTQEPGDAAKIAGFVAIITYGVNMIIKAAKGKTRFM